MSRVLWLVMVLLSAAGCVSGDAWQFEPYESKAVESKSERGLREAHAKSEQPSLPRSVERTGNVTIEVEKMLVGQHDQARLDSVWRYADEHVVVRGGQLARRNGIRVGVSKGGFRAALRAALKESRNKQVERITITTLSGTAGMISVGQDTYVEVLHYRGPRGERALLERAFVGSSLVVEPTILPEDKVRVRLYPRFTTRAGRAIDLAEMSTEVVLAHGQPMVIGGYDKASDNAGFALFAWRQERESRKVTLTLTPFIQGMP
ncbi:MAG: hypothetical protein QGH74_00510 [Candidatus Brocadiia bacterium]|nr:hypothetical protein [Candidatus Brocadiia bacterium]